MIDTPDVKRINPKFLFYDYELQDLFKCVKNLYDIFKRSKTRFDRKETLTLSKSVCDFLQLQKDKDLYPYVLYDFKCNSSRICVVQKSKKYFVYVSVPNYKYVYKKYEKEWVDSDFYGGYDRLSDAVSLFVSVVNYYCVNGQSCEIPF